MTMRRPSQWLFLALGIVAGCSPGYVMTLTVAQAADTKAPAAKKSAAAKPKSKTAASAKKAAAKKPTTTRRPAGK